MERIKTVTLSDIARYTKVSRVSAGKILLGSGADTRVSEATAERIREAAKKLNYRPNKSAQQLAGKKSMCIGVLMDSFAPGVTYRKLSFIERELSLKGYKVMVAQGHDDYNKMLDYIEDFYSRGIDGIISFYFEKETFLKKIATYPNVLIIGTPKKGKLPYVDSDISFGVESLVDHLIMKGRKRIGITIFDANNIHSKYREKGFLKSFKKHALSVDHDLIYRSENRYDEDGINDAVNTLIIKNKADAVIAINDIVAVSIIKKLQKIGIKVPEDIAVAGFDNDMIAWACMPSVTTVDQQEGEIARVAAEMIVELIENNNISGDNLRKIVRPQIVIREST